MGKKIVTLLFLIILLIPIIIVGSRLCLSNKSDNFSIVSPIPDFLNISDNKEVSSLNLWLPALASIFFGEDDAPRISAKSALIYDLTENKALYEKNPKARLPMASLTKIMTAIVAIEHKNNNDKYVVTKEDLVGEDSMGLTEGESLSLNELLYGLMLMSGNDAAEVIATNYPKGRSEFINVMNKKAKALGLKDTNFTNPTGLEGDGDQYTTAYDLLVITKYALSNFPLFGKVVSTFDYTILANNNHKQFDLQNETNLLTTYPGVKGVKTGYTPEAGLCLVTFLDYKGHKIIGVLLASENRRFEMKELLDYSLKSVNITPPKHD